MAINKVEANGETLIDLTNDTAEAADVLEGQTFHLRSGVVATGTYRPSDEIEARLEATVGHSSKNLLEITEETRTISGVTFTIDKQAGTITASGTAATNAQLNIQGDEKRSISTGILKNGQILTCDGIINGTDFGINYYNENGTYISTQRIDATVSVQIVTIPTNAASYRFFLRKLSASGNTSATVYPMLRDGNISDDTFEPYVTPTDEKKQDKPVELDPTVLTWNIADLQSKYTHIQIVCECIDTMTTPNMDIYDVITIPTVIFGRTANTDGYMAFTSAMTTNGFDTVLFTESSGNVSAYINPSVATGTRTIIQIIGIPK